ncbi:hypothetical protein STEG23_006684, partial [Scotinomys teguina]
PTRKMLQDCFTKKVMFVCIRPCHTTVLSSVRQFCCDTPKSFPWLPYRPTGTNLRFWMLRPTGVR